jgi:PAS domain S-box-containing protein
MMPTELTLNEILQQLPVLILMVDPDCKITEIQGYPIRHVIDEAQIATANGQSVDRIFAHMPAIGYDARVALSGKTVNNTIKLGAAAFRAYYQPVRDNDTIVAAVIVLTDIHELTEQAAARSDSETRLKAIFEQTQQFICLLQVNGQVIEVNRVPLEFAGLKRENVLGKPLWELAWWQLDDCAQQLQGALQQCAAGAVVQYETQMWGKDTTTSIDLALKPIKNPQKHVTMILAEGFSIAERKVAEAQMQSILKREQELTDLKARFITLTSHEFRTPLAIIASSAYLLRRSTEQISDEQRDKHFNKIQTNVNRIADMLDDILLLGRLQAKQVGYEPQEYPVSQLAASLVQEYRQHYAQTHTFTFQSTPPDIRIRADQTLLEQALNQLLKNAVIYTTEPGVIDVALALSDNLFTMRVSDNGIGILPAEQKQIFDSFVRGSNVDNAPGNGLGLAIVKDVVALHGGQVTVQSQPGATRFTVTIPQSS